MATISSSAQSIQVNSTISVSYSATTQWYTRSSPTGTGSVTCSVSGIPAGSVITGSSFSCYTKDGTSYGGVTKVNGTQVYGGGPHTVGNGTATSITVPFSFKSTATSGNVGTNPTGTVYAYRTFYNCILTVTYTPPTNINPPTWVSVSPDTVSPSTNATLSWGGASNGTNNSVQGYYVYRSDNWNAAIVNTASTSCTVTSHASNGSSYSYKVRAYGSYGDNGLSSASATLYSVIPYSECTPPTAVSVSPTTTGPGGNATLSWSGAGAGTQNPITGYDIYYNDGDGYASYSTPGNVDSETVQARAENGQERTFIVYTIGTVSGYNSGPSSAYATLTASWTNPTAPTSVTLSSTHVASGNSTLSWSGAETGTNNAIAKYHIYRSVNGAEYAFLIEVTGTSTSVASAAAGSYHTYAVYTGGVVADTWSAISTATATLYTYINPGIAPNFYIEGGASDIIRDAGTTDIDLTWGDSTAGSFNAVAGYHIYKSSNGGAYSHVGTVAVGETKIYTVITPSTMGNYDEYKVYTIGTYSNSAATSDLRITAQTYSQVGVPPTVTTDIGYASSGSTTLRWGTANDGTNTTVSGYRVYKDGVQYGADQGVAVRSMYVPFNANPASTYTYTVQALCATATYNSNQSSGVVLSTYGAPSAPTTITLNTIANNIYVGTENRPTITLAWSGASAGMYAIITKYEVYLDGNLAFTVNTGNTYGSQVVTASGVYTVKVIASSTLTSTSSSRTVYTIGTPTFAGYTVQPSGKTNGTVTYTWTGSTLANTSSFTYHLAYKNGTNATTYITNQSEATYGFNINNYITQGNYYQFGVKVQANAANGGYTIMADYTLSTASQVYRAAAPAIPTITSILDNNGNATYAQNIVKIIFNYVIPTRGANVSKYSIYYKYGATGGFTWLIDNQDKTEDHNITAVAAGTPIYYRIEIVDEYGFTNYVDSTSPITKLVSPTIGLASYTPTDIPNTASNLVFTPGNGGVTRDLEYTVLLKYAGQSYTLKPYTTILAANVGSLLTLNSTSKGISVIGGTGNLTTLFTDVITNKIVNPIITVEITLRDKQTTQVIDNYTTYSFTYTANYRTTPILSGSITLVNQTAVGNGKSGLATQYVSSGDSLRITLSGVTVSWLNAAGTTTGQALTYRLIDYTGVNNLSSKPSIKDITLGTFAQDEVLTVSFSVSQDFNGITTTSTVISQTINARRFIIPTIIYSKFERTAGTVFKTTINLSDPYCGGSSIEDNIYSITNFDITDSTTHNNITSQLSIVDNTLKINSVTAPQEVTLLNVSQVADVTISSSATLTLASGRTIAISSMPFLLKALGVAMSIRKHRVGINVEPVGFIDDVTDQASLVVQSSLNLAGQLVKLISLNENVDGSGILFTHGSTNGILRFDNNLPSGPSQFYLNAGLTNTSGFTGNLTGNVTGNVAGNVAGNLSGNASTAGKVNHLLTLGSQTFDGSAAVTINIRDNSSATAILNTSTYLVTERDIYYGLPTINNVHNYTNTSTLYAPITGGTANQVLKAVGATSIPAWESISDSTSASAISSSGTYLVTERDIYYGLPFINNNHNYTSSFSFYAPITGGTAGQVLKAVGATNTPTWGDMNSLTITTTGGASAGTTYNGSAAVTIDYSTVGAAEAAHKHPIADLTDLSVGGTNLLAGTGLQIAWTILAGMNESEQSILGTVVLQPNTTYTISGQYRMFGGPTNTALKILVYDETETEVFTWEHDDSELYSYVQHTFTTGSVSYGNHTVRFDNLGDPTRPTIIYYKLVKLEKGNVATDWSPAPSDKANTSHPHGNITKDGKVGTVADLLLGTGTSGAVEAKTDAQLKALMLNITYPVGAIYMSVVSTSPATLFGGTWTAIQDRFLVGAGNLYTVNATGGETTHVHTTPNHAHTTTAVSLSVANLASHAHNITYWASDAASGSGGWIVNVGYTSSPVYGSGTPVQAAGSGTAHGHGDTGGAAPTTNSGSSLPPYKAVYMWERTA